MESQVAPCVCALRVSLASARGLSARLGVRKDGTMPPALLPSGQSSSSCTAATDPVLACLRVFATASPPWKESRRPQPAVLKYSYVCCMYADSDSMI